MMANGFKVNECDKCIYAKEMKMAVILCLYVEDMLIVRCDDNMVRFINNMQNSSFEMKDMSLIDVIY